MKFAGTIIRLLILLSISMFVLPTTSAVAGNRGKLLTDSQAQQAGLRTAWSAHIAMDPTQGEIKQIVQYIGPQTYWATFEVTFEDQVNIFSERDIDRFGRFYGVEGAKKRAEKHHAQMLDYGYKATLTPKQVPVAPEVFIYVLTSTSNVHCLNGETGETRWTKQINDRKGPSWIAADQGHVIVIHGTELFYLDGLTGDEKFKKQLGSVPLSKPALSGNIAFVPSVSGAIKEIQLDKNGKILRSFRVPGRVIAAPLSITQGVVWVNNQGDLYLASTDHVATDFRRYKFRLNTEEKLNSAPTFLEKIDPETGIASKNIILATDLGTVHNINEESGIVAWSYYTNYPVSLSPVALGEQVFVATRHKTLFSIDAKTGTEQWRANDIKQVLSVSEKRLYAINTRNNLVVLDRTTGNRVSILPTASLNFHFVNQQTDRILIGSKTGMIQCLRETENNSPYFHRRINIEEKTEIIDQPTEKPGTGEEKSPFGGDEGVDEKEDKEDKGEEKDPFDLF